MSDWSFQADGGTQHSSRPFNPDIASTFFRSGLIETWGRGIERIQEACEAAGVPAPEWSVQGSDFWTTFYFAEGVEAVTGGLIEEGRPESEQNTGQVTEQVAGQVTGQVEQLLQQLTGDLSRKEMMAKLGLKGRDNFEKLYLLPALKDELIEMTIPDKPNSRLQKYRLTAKGKNLANHSSSANSLS